MVADRAQGADQEFHDGRVHRRQNDKIQVAGFRQQRMQSIHGRQARALERIERPAADGKANAVIEAGT
jgi:transcription initiation factor TFIID subunit TAF12